MNDNDNNIYPDNGGQNNQDVPWYQQNADQKPQEPVTPEPTVYNEDPGFSQFSSDPQPEPAPQPEPQPAPEEPVYSPYSSEYNYNYSNPAPQQGGANKGGNKKKSSQRILAVILAVIVVFCGVFGTYLVKNRNKNSSSTEGSTASDGPTLQIEDSKSTVNVDESDGLSSSEIYAKNQKSICNE